MLCITREKQESKSNPEESLKQNKERINKKKPPWPASVRLIQTLKKEYSLVLSASPACSPVAQPVDVQQLIQAGPRHVADIL